MTKVMGKPVTYSGFTACCTGSRIGYRRGEKVNRIYAGTGVVPAVADWNCSGDK
jgi:hypothetical protein